MFKSFFPSPKWFFTSLLLWSAVGIAVWYSVGDQLGLALGFGPFEEDPAPVIGLGHFTTPEFMWFYAFVGFFFVIFAGAWMSLSRHPWQRWSVLGTCYILFFTYYSVQVSVAINNWYRPFYDLLQAALGGEAVTIGQFVDYIVIFMQIAMMYVILMVINAFVVAHYIFRWRTSMTEYYSELWPKVRHIEGASQRIQEDTMRFAAILKGLGTNIVDSVMTLIAFLPVLWGLSQYVTELPIVGDIPAPLVVAAIFWAAFGTGILALAGIKLPGLEFQNQRVEAAYRKELVYGEDNDERADPVSLRELFGNVRKSYFRIYKHYTYFNMVRYSYLQADNIFALVLLLPSIVAGKLTLGIYSQISSAFGQVSNSFQFLVNSWTTIIDLISVYKRLASFEAAMNDQPLVDEDQKFEAGVIRD
ncbi:MAG: peptide antibiotic transporter SbmA [Gammaproteobacteria bacterium]|nr:peptide antibiotic transporter SbmA [Gammaproteobacteria bacterium]